MTRKSMLRVLDQAVAYGSASREARESGLPRISPPDLSMLPSAIGVVCSGKIAAYRDEVKAYLERGIAKHPDAEWVCLEKRSDAMTRDLLLQLGVDPKTLALDPIWKIEGRCDVRRVMRDGEMLRCGSVVVFTSPETKSYWREKYDYSPRVHENLHLVELDKPAKKKAK